MSYLRDKLMPDFWKSLRSWHVWTHMAVRDVKNRFRGTVAGAGWLFFSLMAITGSIALIYGSLFGMSTKEFVPYLVLGLVLWGFITSTCVDGAFAFVQAQGYIMQINFPKQVYILRSFWSSLMLASPGLVVYLCMVPMLWPLGWGILWVFPGLLLLAVAAVGHVWIFAYLTARYRDIPHAVSAMLQILYFLTPVIYPPRILADRGLSMVFMANPFYWFLSMVREPLLNFGPAEWHVYALAGAYCCVIWTAAIFVGVKLDRKVVYYL